MGPRRSKQHGACGWDDETWRHVRCLMRIIEHSEASELDIDARAVLEALVELPPAARRRAASTSNQGTAVAAQVD